MKPKIKILVANRGEIAIRIFRTCRVLGIPSVAVFTDVDQLALHVRYADEAIAIGEKDAYLNIESILKAAKKSKATAIHPGYGFLSENETFAKAVEEAGLFFIGPRPETIALLGNKMASRKAAADAGLPVLPGSDEPLPLELPLEMAEGIIYPVLVKAAAGGGGRGIRLANSPEELPHIVEAARQEALATFGDGTVFLESMVRKARHIEVQILGDGRGNILCLGERECSIQRRRQKLIEETPAPNLSARLRSRLFDASFQLGKFLKYRGLGTVEFLVDEKKNFHFIEVNPRIQVEHPVTEMVTGMDLVKEQIVLALGPSLPLSQEMVDFRGAAIETRVLAEDPIHDFLPSTGKITHLHEPGGLGIRVDSALYTGMEVGADYDSLLAKVIAWSEDRPTTIQRMRCALDEFQIGGLETDLEFLKEIINSPHFMTGRVTTTYLDDFQSSPPKSETELEYSLALAAAIYANQQRKQKANPACQSENLWKRAAWLEQMPGHN